MWNVITRRTFAAGLAGVAAGPAAARGREPAGALLDRGVPDLLRQFGEPGLAVAVVSQGRIRLARGYGIGDIATGAPVTPDTAFMFGSLTKSVNAAGLGLLVDQGRLELDRPVARVLPQFGLADEAQGAAVTVSDLLTHATGLPAHNLVWYGAPDFRRDQAPEAARELPLSAPRGTRWQYNNLMYVVAGCVLERLAAGSWEPFTQARLLQPLGMRAAGFGLSAFLAHPLRAAPHAQSGQRILTIPPYDLSAVAPAGGLVASIREAALWVRFLLDGRDRHGRPLLSPETRAQLQRPRLATGRPDRDPGVTSLGYACGLHVDSYRGEPRLQHTGSIDGFHAYMVLFPKRNLGLLAVCNAEGGRSPEAALHMLSDHLLDLPAVDWPAHHLRLKAESTPPAPVAQDADAAQLTPRHEGRYAHPAYGSIRIYRRDGRPRLALHGLDVQLAATPGSGLVTRSSGVGALAALDGVPVSFDGDRNGAPETLSATLEPAAAPIVFRKLG